MSCKLRPKGQCFPSEIIDGVLKMHIGDSVITKEVPYVKSNFQMNDVYFANTNISSYAKNDSYVSVIRWDGSYSLYLRDGTLCSFCKRDDFNIGSDIQVFRKCSVVSNENGLLYEVWIYLLAEDDKVIFDPVNTNSYVVLDTSHNVEFLKDLYNATYFFPVFRFIEGKYCKVANAESFEPIYQLNGDIIAPSSEIVLL